MFICLILYEWFRIYLSVYLLVIKNVLFCSDFLSLQIDRTIFWKKMLVCNTWQNKLHRQLTFPICLNASIDRRCPLKLLNASFWLFCFENPFSSWNNIWEILFSTEFNLEFYKCALISKLGMKNCKNLLFFLNFENLGAFFEHLEFLKKIFLKNAASNVNSLFIISNFV